MLELKLKVFLFLGMQISCRIKKLQSVVLFYIYYQIVIAKIVHKQPF